MDKKILCLAICRLVIVFIYEEMFIFVRKNENLINRKY